MSSIAPGSVPIVFARLRRSPWSVVGRSGPPWARRNSSAGTTRISRPSPSRIVTGATLSSSAAALPSADFILPLETRLSGTWVRPPPCGKVLSQGGVSWGRCRGKQSLSSGTRTRISVPVGGLGKGASVAKNRSADRTSESRIFAVSHCGPPRRQKEMILIFSCETVRMKLYRTRFLGHTRGISR
jgi:hypothetical protein